jgi:hypothetical protein
MNLDDAVVGMMDAREKLRSRQGVTDPYFISEQMQRLAQYTGAVEEHLAQYEEDLELEEHRAFKKHSAYLSVNQAEKLAKDEVSELKGKIAKFKRYVNSSWALIGVAQSRFNHINKSNVGQI